MIIINALRQIKNLVTPSWTRPELALGYSLPTITGQTVTPEKSKQIATAYRCANIISDDLAIIPLQQYISRKAGEIQRVFPDPIRRNMAYTVEIQPNPYQVPFILRKTAILWLLFWGDCYIWSPPGANQLYVLNSSVTTVEIRRDGSLWYRTVLADNTSENIPGIEVLHLMINSTDGLRGKSVIAYARETLGRRMGGAETQSMIYKKGLMPGAIATVESNLNKEAREKIRQSYWEAASGSSESGGVVVVDNTISKFELVQIKPVDAQFLESIQATDVEIANFFGLPLYKLNQGKQSYESNEQQDQDYLRSTLDPYLVQWEQAAKIHWLNAYEQSFSYWKFNRDAFLRMNSKARATYLKDKILSGQYTPNQALAVDDQPAYVGGDVHYIPSNMAVINTDGEIKAISGKQTEMESTEEEQI